MKKLMIAMLLAAGAIGSSAAFAAHYTVYPSWAVCKAAAKAATKAGQKVSDCRPADGGWTYDPPGCQDGQCVPD